MKREGKLSSMRLLSCQDPCYTALPANACGWACCAACTTKERRPVCTKCACLVPVCLQSFSLQNILQMAAIALLAGLFWLQKAGNDTVAAARNTLGKACKLLHSGSSQRTL